MGFIRWFKGSLEDELGVASFRRIYNWILICLVAFLVCWATFKNTWSMYFIYALIILLVAGFLNTSVITVDNILRFFNRDKSDIPAQPQKADVSGTLNISPQKTI